jgi:hypothetical protein
MTIQIGPTKGEVLDLKGRDMTLKGIFETLDTIRQTGMNFTPTSMFPSDENAKKELKNLIANKKVDLIEAGRYLTATAKDAARRENLQLPDSFSITVDTKKNEFKIIHQLKKPYRITDLKGIYDNYLIMLEECIYKNILIIDLNKFEIINKKKFEIFFIDCLVYNGNILIPEYNCIYFYSIPNLEKISCLELSNDIFYMNITNNKTFIVTEKNCIEQFETKTWRIISKYNDNNKIMNNIFIIGAGKKLFLFDDKLNIIYNAIK